MSALRWLPGAARTKWKLEKRRAEALSSITGDRVHVQLMAQRPRKPDDPQNDALLAKVLAQIDDIEEKARNAAHADELDDLKADGVLQGLFAAYFCPVDDIQDEGTLVIDNLEGWGIPKSAVRKLRELFTDRLKNASKNPENARSALHAIFSEQDSWSDYVDGYADSSKSYHWQLGGIAIVLVLLSMTALYCARYFSPLLWLGLFFAGGAGSSIGTVAKLPALDESLSGELDTFERRIFSGTVAGAIASLIGCAFLGWGVFPVAIQNQTFTDALNACAAPSTLPGSAVKILIALGVAMILGFSERTLHSLERRLLGVHKPEEERRFPEPRKSSRKG